MTTARIRSRASVSAPLQYTAPLLLAACCVMHGMAVTPVGTRLASEKHLALRAQARTRSTKLRRAVLQSSARMRPMYI